LRKENKESQNFKDFIEAIIKGISKALDIPYDVVAKNYEKEKAKRKKGN
jgi:hypothetical protein